MFGLFFSKPSRGRPVPRRAVQRSTTMTQHQESLYLDGALPPISIFGLRSIEKRSTYAHPIQIHRWIKDIRQQLDDMYVDDREFANALLLKLEHKVGDR